MLSHSGSVTLSASLLTLEGKYTFRGYLLHALCFGNMSIHAVFCLGTRCTERGLGNVGHCGVEL